MNDIIGHFRYKNKIIAHIRLPYPPPANWILIMDNVEVVFDRQFVDRDGNFALYTDNIFNNTIENRIFNSFDWRWEEI